MVRRQYNMSFITALLCIGACLVEGGSSSTPSRRMSLPFFPRGGSSSAVATRSKQKQHRSSKFKPIEPTRRPLRNLHQGLIKARFKLQSDATQQWQGIASHVTSEWDKLSCRVQQIHLPKLPQLKKKLHTNSRLDEVYKSFSTVLRSNNEVDTASLLKACRSHLHLMQSAGSSLKLVAKDLESNLHKAERLYKSDPKECRHLKMLLEKERRSGIHGEGSVLKDPSAAIGLLWIRRSLEFQKDLYASLAVAPSDSTASSAEHPKDAALKAYNTHLSPYHGWALRKVFPASLSQMPDRSVFLCKFGGLKHPKELSLECEREICQKLERLVNVWEALLGVWKGDFERLGLEDTRRV
mmetsp:Transcript_22419/g.48747  ORF Transcript_22419/g.48747 Transcript_22419/m.48747 type:complete len:353 (-) Transcript_22419:280-1338(-)